MTAKEDSDFILGVRLCEGDNSVQFRVNAACADFESIQCHYTTSDLQHLFVYYAAHNGVVLETEHESERSILGHGIVVRYDRRYECRLEPYK